MFWFSMIRALVKLLAHGTCLCLWVTGAVALPLRSFQFIALRGNAIEMAYQVTRDMFVSRPDTRIKFKNPRRSVCWLPNTVTNIK